jgi:2-C-methyl-D-erythritol 4-phosphate cytidylyltransferase
MNKYAIIVAGGEGKRMGTTVPKQFLQLAGKPILYHTLKQFLGAFSDLKIILVLPEGHIAVGQEIIDAWFDYSRITIAIGGDSRFQSVKNGLAFIEDDNAIIAVHDAVRCLVSQQLIKTCFDTAASLGTALPVLPCTDSVRILTDDTNEFFPRANVKLVQTPQVFHSKIIIPAYNIEYKEKYTDEASVVDAFGMQLQLIEGEDENIKITTPKDILLAEYILGNRGEVKVAE